jgi:hypothetical protein
MSGIRSSYHGDTHRPTLPQRRTGLFGLVWWP